MKMLEMKRSEVKVTGHGPQKPEPYGIWRHVYLRAADQAPVAQVATANWSNHS